MAITKIRGLQVKPDSLTSDNIKDHSINSLDIAAGSLDGAMFIAGSIPAEKIDVASLAGDGLVYNAGTNKLDVTSGAGATTDASLLTSGTLDDARLSSAVTLLGNTFNGADQLVKLLSDGKLPVLDGSNLTGIAVPGAAATSLATTGLPVDISTAAPPIPGQALIATGTTSAAWLTSVGGITFVDQASPIGVVDGVNMVFVLPSQPSAGSLHFYVNGILQRGGAGNDYTLSASTVTMSWAPSTGSTILASYRL